MHHLKWQSYIYENGLHKAMYMKKELNKLDFKNWGGILILKLHSGPQFLAALIRKTSYYPIYIHNI